MNYPLKNMSISFNFIKLKFSGLKLILFYPEYQETIFWNINSSKTLMRKSLNFGKNHGLNFKEKVDFLALLRTLPFWSKNHSFLSKIKRNHLFWLDYTKKQKWKQVRYFNKKPWIIPPRKMSSFWHFIKH